MDPIARTHSRLGTDLALLSSEGRWVIPAVGLATDKTVGERVDSAKESAKDAATTVKREVSDSWITLKTKMALLADERVSGLDVNVTTENGVVTLRGKVNSETARQAAEEVALNIDGAKRVVNHLTVVPKAAAKMVDRKDDQIEKDVERRISKNPRLKKADIDVRVDKGIVTLTGKAPSLKTSLEASQVARRAPGVRAVRNELKVEAQG